MYRYIAGFIFTLLSISLVSANPAHEQLSNMAEPKRRDLMAFILKKSGEKCTKVTRTFYQGQDDKGNAFWNAACSEGGHYSILITNDEKGSTRVLNCKVLQELKAPPCFKKFKV